MKSTGKQEKISGDYSSQFQRENSNISGNVNLYSRLLDIPVSITNTTIKSNKATIKSNKILHKSLKKITYVKDEKPT